MGKPQKKKSVADRVRKVKASTEIKNNPFEVKINRKKFDVLGQKTKHDVGLPGVSRSKAIKKRKETLLKEYKLKDKSNKFVDRRIGEYDSQMDPEDKILKRFALERQRTQGKRSIYNLNEDEELTHFGQSLADIEKLNDVVDSDSDSEERGLLSAELTASHFGGGGGLLRKKAPGESGDEGSQKPKSRQELIEELILKSKQEKRERQTQKEESQELTEKLDQDWKSIQGLLAHKTPKAERKELEEKPKPDEYDMTVRELAFEMKAQPSERMKTQEELAREERDRLQKLEADRQRRMQGDTEEDSTTKQTYLSADDLNDGFLLNKDDQRMLSYHDGKWNLEDEVEKEEEDAEGDDEGDDKEEEDDDGDDNSGEEAEEEEDIDGESGHSDLESDKDSEQEGGDEEGPAGEEAPTKPCSSLSEEEKLALQEAARAELPYTFVAPESYSELKSLLHGHTTEEQCLIVDRIQKCNHPSLGMGNKLKLQKLFDFLLEYVGELATRCPPELSTVNKLVPQLYALCQLFPNAACKAMQTLLSDSAHDMAETLEVKGRTALPGLDMLIYLKITALLFPTSDFRHPVTTPAMVYISQLLTKSHVSSLEEVTSGLALCCLTVEYVTLSQRFVPELINFLLVFHPIFQYLKGFMRVFGLVCPFTMQKQRWSVINVGHCVTLMDSFLFLRLSSLTTCLDLVKRCTLLYKSLPSFSHIFQSIRILLAKHLPIEGHPRFIQVTDYPYFLFRRKKIINVWLISDFSSSVVSACYFRLDYGKKRGSSKQERERERLKHKYKREFKGALREIRKDTKFLATEKLTEVMERDAERKRKVKELFGSLATQEGEWKALKRRKK
uniref:NOP14 nucleolar protein homolog (yeast) n=1 Tax=Scleropages formosus TaxID=113540 RepID=A0A8C9T7I3_SCLFO